MGATAVQAAAGHLRMISDPAEAAELIRTAAEAV
jgi:hypothetical protein